MSSPFRAYIERSVQVLRRNSQKILSANPSPTTPTSSHLLYSLTLNPLLPSPTSSPSSSTSQPSQPSLALTDFATGSDSDIGGLSTCTLDFDENGDGRFWGEMRTGVRGEFRGKVRGGYAGFRNKNLQTLFGPQHHDLSLYTHLALTIRPSGDLQTLRHWFVNVQTDGPVQSDLFQHPLTLPPSSLTPPSSSSSSSPSSHPTSTYNTWQTIHLPLSSFLLTNSGTLSETQIPMMKTRVRTVGLSILGGRREGMSALGGMGKSKEGREGPVVVERMDEDEEIAALRPGSRAGGGAKGLVRGGGEGEGVEGRFEMGIREIRAVNLSEGEEEGEGQMGDGI